MGSKTVMVEECTRMQDSKSVCVKVLEMEFQWITTVLWPKAWVKDKLPPASRAGNHSVENVEPTDVICAGVIVSGSATNQCASISFSYKCNPQP